MHGEWIKARLALQYVSENAIDYSAQRRICERAHSGLIAAKAERIVWGGKEERDHIIGKGFWWAKGHEALEQDWSAGDFSTWIDHKVEVKAFDVSFDFAALSDLVPAEKQAAALRRISVIASEEWISARDLHLAVLKSTGPSYGSDSLLEACRLGQLGARAMRANCHYRQRSLLLLRWRALEWDVPLWFWRDFTKQGSGTKYEWALNKVSGRGQRDFEDYQIDLQGLHFHRSGLINLGLATDPLADDRPNESRRGRKPEYDWPAANAAIWGKIVRGELIPNSQAEIEKALQAYLAKGDREPSESTVRPYANRIWEEYSKA
jgi:hypothetical protein